MVSGSAGLEATTSKLYRSGTGVSVRSVIVVCWPTGIALVSERVSICQGTLDQATVVFSFC
jgi:hypothetical protein